MTLYAQLQTDLAQLFDTNELGESATYAPVAGGSSSIPVIFVGPGEEIDLGQVSVIAEDPTVFVRMSDAASLAENDTLTIRSTAYKVKEVFRDGLTSTTGGIWRATLVKGS